MQKPIKQKEKITTNNNKKKIENQNTNRLLLI